MGIWAEIAKALNSTIKDPTKFKPLDKLITDHGVKIFTSDDTFIVPDGINKIWVTACGGGGGGGSCDSSYSLPAGGGGGGACIIRKPFSVTPGEEISIIIGAGGLQSSAKTCGQKGGSTVIGNLITLEGGDGGGGGGTKGGNGGNGGTGGGGGGAGGNNSSNTVYNRLGGSGYIQGGHSILIGDSSSKRYPGNGGGGCAGGSGGCGGHDNNQYLEYCAGGGGGGSIGNGGNGGSCYSTGYVNATDGEKGGGGGGGAYYNSNYKTNGGKGGDGIAIIEW